MEARLEKCLRILRKGDVEIAGDSKAAPWKVATAVVLKGELACGNAWLGQRLRMVTEFGVSHYVSALNGGKRPAAIKIFTSLTPKIK